MDFDLKKAFLTKKPSEKHLLDSYVMDNGIAVIDCRVTCREDLIHPFSTPGYESLSDPFSSYLNTVGEGLPTGAPVMIRIIGYDATAKDRNAVCHAIRNFFLWQANIAQQQIRRSLLQVGWFILCLIGVCVWLLLADDPSRNQIYLNLIFVLFYFFGDAIIRTPVLENGVLRNNRARYVQLSAAKIVFCPELPKDDPLTDEEAQQIADEVLRNLDSIR